MPIRGGHHAEDTREAVLLAAGGSHLGGFRVRVRLNPTLNPKTQLGEAIGAEGRGWLSRGGWHSSDVGPTRLHVEESTALYSRRRLASTMGRLRPAVMQNARWKWGFLCEGGGGGLSTTVEGGKENT